MTTDLIRVSLDDREIELQGNISRGIGKKAARSRRGCSGSGK